MALIYNTYMLFYFKCEENSVRTVLRLQSKHLMLVFVLKCMLVFPAIMWTPVDWYSLDNLKNFSTSNVF